MPLLVGLGNPGPRYEGTRHNVGFDLVDALAQAWGAGPRDWKPWGKALVCGLAHGGLRLWAVKPQTFMNLSGEAVQALMAFRKIPPAETAVVTDDVELPVGSLRIRPTGGPGGHNGLRDIVARVGEGFPRIRVGVGPKPPGWDLSAFVLGKMGPAEGEALQELRQEFPALVETGFTQGWDLAATRFNRRRDPPAH